MAGGDVITVIRDSLAKRLGLGISLIGVIALAVVASYEFILEQDFVRLVLVGVFLILFGGIGLVSVLRFRVEITGDFVEKRGVRTTQIQYDEIDCVELSEDKVVLRSGKATIVLYSAGGLRDRGLEVIAEKLRNRPDVRITGDQSMIDAYF